MMNTHSRTITVATHCLMFIACYFKLTVWISWINIRMHNHFQHNTMGTSNVHSKHEGSQCILKNGWASFFTDTLCNSLLLWNDPGAQLTCRRCRRTTLIKVLGTLWKLVNILVVYCLVTALQVWVMQSYTQSSRSPGLYGSELKTFIFLGLPSQLFLLQSMKRLGQFVFSVREVKWIEVYTVT